MGLAKMFASCFVNALVSKGIAVPPENLEDIKQSLQHMRASTGMQADYLLLFQHFLQRFRCVHPLTVLAGLQNFPQTLFATELANKFCPKEQNYSPFSKAMPTMGVKTILLANLLMIRTLTVPVRKFTCKRGVYCHQAVTHVTATVRVMHSHQRHYLLLASSFKNY